MKLKSLGTKIVKINPKHVSKNKIKIISNIIKRGGVVVYPTETCYGLGVDATNLKAVKKVNKIKKRSGKPIHIIVSDLKMMEKYGVLTKEVKLLCRKFMPGPLTLIVKKKKLPDVLSKKDIGFRISSNKIASSLSKYSGVPITATSANISGKGQLYRIKDIVKVFNGKIDVIIDSGNLRKNKPSTVVNMITKRVVRKGAISAVSFPKA